MSVQRASTDQNYFVQSLRAGSYVGRPGEPGGESRRGVVLEIESTRGEHLRVIVPSDMAQKLALLLPSWATAPMTEPVELPL